MGAITVHHPRYLLFPKISMPLHGFLMFLGSFRLAMRLHRERPFHCVDAHYVYPDGFAGVLLGKMLGVPVFVSARGTDVNLFPSFRLIRPMIRYALRKSTGAIAVCQALKDAMVELGIPGEKIEVIGNGVDTERFHPVEQEESRRLLGLSGILPILIAVGSLIPRKGYQFLIPAIAKIVPRYPRLGLFIIGEGSYRPALETLIQEHKLTAHVHMIGHKSNEKLRLWYNAGDLSCLVSSREGWPNVILESLACGTPVVATGVWGAPEVITSPDLGIIVKQRIDDIAEGLRLALEKPWDRERLARYAQSRTWDVVARELEAYLAARLAIPH